jgi:hypothetical protein
LHCGFGPPAYDDLFNEIFLRQTEPYHKDNKPASKERRPGKKAAAKKKDTPHHRISESRLKQTNKPHLLYSSASFKD